MKTFEQLWKDLEENFDWGTVHKTMVFLKWNWSTFGGVPTQEQVKNSAKGWLKESYDKSKRGGKRSSTTCCGGFTAKYAEFYGDRVESINELTLEFTIESFSVW